ncbi:hypothetical protein DBR23_05965 [Acidovorax sp. HMWF018]|uniref:hypothetical protein n=1 Tax=Acidovorax sp. HMWF018 TaxID=2056855 RepID=UPI000D374E28|nr:hypothetical protein [Acidovorax sp. HMWF018]PTT41492.1 hypothetical protein DBR23_05965 [Acidovorax sp. HMWF018]
MAEQINNGGPAFPVSTGNPDAPHQDGHTTAQFPGMTLRDYFAAKALQGLLSDSKVQAPRSEFAAEAYAMADEMLRAREGGAA